MSTAEKVAELTKEQLLEYVKKQRVKVKKLEAEITNLKGAKESSAPSNVANDSNGGGTLWEKKFKEQQELVNDLQIALKARDEELQRKDSEVALLKEQNESECAASSNYVETATRLETELSKVTARCEELNMELVSTKEDFSAFKQSSAIAQSELNEKLTHAQQSLASKEAMCTQLQQQLHDNEESQRSGDSEKLAASEELIATLQSELKNVSVARETLADQAAQSNQDKQLLEEKLTRIEQELAHVQQQVVDVENTKLSLAEKLKQVQVEMITLSEKATRSSALENELDEARSMIQNLEENNKEVAETNQSNVQQIVALETRIAELNENIAERDRSIEILQTSLTSAEENASSAPPTGTVETNTATEVGGKKKGKNNKKGKAKNSLDSVTTNNETEEGTVALEQQGIMIKQLTEERDELQKQLRDVNAEHEQQLKQLELKLKSVEDEFEQSASHVSAQSNEINDLKQNIVQLEKEKQICDEKYNDFESTMNCRVSELEASNENLKKETEMKLQEVSSDKSDTANQIAKLNDETISLQERVDELLQKEAEYTMQMDKDRKLLDQRNDELKELMSAVEKNEAAVKQLNAQIDVLEKEKVEAVEKESKTREELQQSLVDLKSIQTKNGSATEEKERQLQIMEDDVKKLNSEITELRAKLVSDETNHVSELESIRQRTADEMQELVKNIKAANEREKTVRDELSELNASRESMKEQHEQLETTNKKLMAKLKTKMKELNDANSKITSLEAQLSEINQRHSDAAGAITKELEGNLRKSEEATTKLQNELQDVTKQKAELESKLKVLQDNQISTEERISKILQEKNQLQEDMFSVQRKAEEASKEANQLKIAGDDLKQHSVDLEKKLQASREKEEELKKKLTQLSESNEELSSKFTKATEDLALHAAEDTKNSSTLSQLREKLKTSNANTEALKDKLKSTQQESDSKIEGLNEKVKKLKSLLAKVNAVSQEKEVKLQQLQHQNSRCKRFEIINRLGVVPRHGESEETLQFCLIYDHDPQGTTTADAVSPDVDTNAQKYNQYRWLEERLVHKWIAEGSSMLGTWPDAIQDAHNRELRDMQSRLQSERDDLRIRLDEVSENFQAYKIRAQTALKRAANEDRNERQRQQEAENAEIDRLNGVILDLREIERSMNDTLALRDQTLGDKQKEIDELKKQLDEVEKSLLDAAESVRVSESKINKLQEMIEEKDAEIEQIKELHEAAEQHRDRRLLQMQKDEAEALRLMTAAEQDRSSPRQGLVLHHQSQENGTDDSAAEQNQVQHSVSFDAQSSRDGPENVTARRSPRGNGIPLLHAEAVDAAEDEHNPNKLLLFQQADHVLRDNLNILRQENSQLTMELLELKNDLGLREDQVTALKTTIRELEASIAREREFNAANRRINADYLVNVLRNFLMSTDPSERAKLVMVLCQILQFQHDDTKLISEVWAVRTGGIVGWLLPQRPVPSKSAMKSASTKDGIPGEGMSMQRGGDVSDMDISYDPTTGAGIDVTGY